MGAVPRWNNSHLRATNQLFMLRAVTELNDDKNINFRRKLGTWRQRQWGSETGKDFSTIEFSNKKSHTIDFPFSIKLNPASTESPVGEWASGKWTRIKSKSVMDNTAKTFVLFVHELLEAISEGWSGSEWEKRNGIKSKGNRFSWMILARFAFELSCAQKSQIIK